MYRKIIFILTILISSYAFVQTSESSAYSSWGIGNPEFYGDAYTSSLGGISSVSIDSTQTNLFNPASYSLLAKQLPLFSFGLTHIEKKIQENDLLSNARYTGITHFSLAVPFAKRFGMALGLKPLSRVGYDINSAEKIQEDSIFYNYKGKGDIQELLVGFSYNIINNPKHRLAAGVNALYYFGRINQERKSYQVHSTKESGGLDITSLHANGWGTELGVFYSYQPNRTHGFSIGGTYRPGLNTKFEKEHIRYSYTDFLNTQTYDTIYNLGPNKGLVYIPSKMKVGVSYNFTPTNEEKGGSRLLPSLKIAFEYSLEDWSNYQEKFDGNIHTEPFVNSGSYRLGIEYVPHRLAADRSAYIKYISKISFRLGAFQVSTPYEVANNQLINSGITAGFGFPFVINRAVSTINLSGSYGSFGAKDIPGSLQEKYFGINFGINIAPGYDRWFRKYKLD